MVSLARMDARTDARRSGRLVYAPEDCTNTASIRTFASVVRGHIAAGVRELTVDLSRVRRMNAFLLAALLQMVREAGRVGGRLRIKGASDEFRTWAGVFQLLDPLEKRGILAAK